jgi:2OG-Fe(II) oxygenase superfamily
MSIIGSQNVLSEEECKEIIYYLDVVDREDLWSPSTDPYWDRRTVEAMNISDYPVLPILKKAYVKIRSAVPAGLEASAFRIVVWGKGMSAGLHTDDMYVGREYASILYLNDGFIGGHTDFPDQGLSVEPRTGLGIVFQGNSEYPHKVTEIESGTRYVITSFWTNNPEYRIYEGWVD